MNIRYVIEAVIAAIVMMILVVGWQLIQGMMLISKATPDISSEYASINELQSTVSFGVISQHSWVLSIAGVIVFIIVYYAVRYWIGHMKKVKN